MNFLSFLSPHVHWAMRLSLAATFIYHGLGKWPPESFSQAFGMPVALAWAVMIAEVVGGLALSTIFTLFLIPALFSLVLDARYKLTGKII